MSLEMKDFSNPNAEAYRQEQETKKKQKIGAVFAAVLEAGSMAPAVAAETQKEEAAVTSPSGQEQQSDSNGGAVLYGGMSKQQIDQAAKAAVSGYEASQDVDWRHGKTDAQIEAEADRALHGGSAPKVEDDKGSDQDVDWRGGKTDQQIQEEANRVLHGSSTPNEDYATKQREYQEQFDRAVQKDKEQMAARAEREVNIASEQAKQIDYIWGVKNRQQPDLLASGIIDETTHFEIRTVGGSFHLFVEGNEVPISSVDIFRDGGSHLFHTEQGNIFIPTYIVRGRYRPSFGDHSVRLEINNN